MSPTAYVITPAAPETDPESPSPAGSEPPQADCEAVVEDEVLVEEISIDGMCGVY